MRFDGDFSCPLLDCINLSKNNIKTIKNLSSLTQLNSIILSHNCIQSVEDVVHLLQVPSLQTVDLQHNKISDPAVVDILSQLPDLRVLYLQGNDVVKKIPHYRKTIISKIKELKYLDDRPVFDDERRRVTAWAKALNDGLSLEMAQQAEREEILKIRKEQQDADERNFRAFEDMMIAARQRIQNDAVQVEINPFSGESIIPVPESEALKEIREARWKVNENTTPNQNCDAAVQPIWDCPEVSVEDIGVEIQNDESGTDLAALD